ncbi:MAG: serine--tRNA ligase [Flavobacteriales bacterium]|nr:serine--tRNA ligase [Bacteroidota bacterium]MCB9241853.1 serine--tRNA ligase [Flavobacteriales bacterium]
MLQVNHIRSNTQEVLNALSKRGKDFSEPIQKILNADDDRKNHQTALDALKAEMNTISKEIGDLYKAGKRDEAEIKKGRTENLKEEIKVGEEALRDAEQRLFEALTHVPNTPHDNVVKGHSAEDNEIVLTWGTAPTLAQNKPHWELTNDYDLIDFELGVKVTGAGFPVYKGAGARLQRALINFFLDEALQAGYKEIQPPIFINEASGFGTGQLPDKEGQMYHMTIDNLFAIPTAEVPITNLYRDVILKESELPVKNVGYTPCFRREAGSYGKDVRGLNRLHQFDKVEIVQIAHPDDSYQILEEMSAYVQGLLQKLGLHYRVLRLCGGDMGFTSALTYDMEVWSAAQEKWLEVSSVSCFETYQSNRLKLRFKNEDGKNMLAHTLNGSALALPRIVAALLENNQTETGINMPEVLRPYLGFDKIS